MCRTVPRRPVVSCRMATSSLKVRLSGPPSSRIWLRWPGSVTARSTRAATSVADTKLTGLSPRPNTRIFPEVSTARPVIMPQVSMKAVARTMVQGRPLARSTSSAACLPRNSSMGWPGDARHRYQNERRADPGGGVDQVGIAGPVYRCRGDATGATGASEAVHGGDNHAGAAERTGEAAGVAERHRGPPPRRRRPGVALGQGRGSAPAPPGPGRPGAGPAGCRGCQCPGDDDHRLEPGPGSGADPASRPTCWRGPRLRRPLRPARAPGRTGPRKSARPAPRT